MKNDLMREKIECQLIFLSGLETLYVNIDDFLLELYFYQMNRFL